MYDPEVDQLKLDGEDASKVKVELLDLVSE